MDCLFCKILAGEIPAKKVFEDEFVFAFLDISPESNGHTLVIPKKHYTDLLDTDNEMISHIMDASRNIHKILVDKLHIEGLTLVQNNGCPQEVKHYHMHLVPKYVKEEDLVIQPVDSIYELLINKK